MLFRSYGGAVALAWALHEPAKPAALVLVSAVSLPWPGKLDPWYRLTSTRIGAAIAIPLAAAFIPKSYIEGAISAVFAPSPVPPGYEVTIGTGLALRRETLRINARQVNELRGQIVVMEPLYADLRLPIELIHGTADTIVPLTVHSAPFADQMPNSVLTIIEGAGHMPHQSHPDLIIAAIDRAAVRAGLR